MTAQGPFQVTEQFERALCEYTGAPYAIAVDSCSSALFLALMRKDVRGKDVDIPRHTYPSVPCAIIHAGGRVRWAAQDAYTAERGDYLCGVYALGSTKVVDSALRFTAGMYAPGYTQCLSFSGAYKHLKLGKGGAILTESAEDAAWFKRARFSGRNECSYHDDHFDMLGWNCYMHPLIAAQGLLLMGQFLRADGSRAVNADLSIRFPDLSRFPIYTTMPAHDADKLARGLTDPTGELGDVLRGFVGPSRETERAGVQIRAVVPEPAEPHPDYYAYRGNP